MNEFPPPPVQPGEGETLTRKERATPRGALSAATFALVIVAAVVGLAVAGFLWLEPAADKRPSPVAEPERPPTPLSLEFLQKKTEVIAGYISKGQPEGGAQILTDTLSGTNCEIVFAGQVTVSRKEARAQRLEVATWRGEMKKASVPAGQALLVTTAEAKGPEGIAFVGIAVLCPAEAV